MLFQTEFCKCGKIKEAAKACQGCRKDLLLQRAEEAARRQEARAERNKNPFSR
jgi:hypothetical protein